MAFDPQAYAAAEILRLNDVIAELERKKQLAETSVETYLDETEAAQLRQEALEEWLINHPA
jgi:hypothetical protein